jgi:acetylornithine deacetylase
MRRREQLSAIDSYVSDHRRELVGLALDLIGCRPSYAAGRQGVLAAQELLYVELSELGMTPVIELPSPDLASHLSFVDPAEIVSEPVAADQFTHPCLWAKWDVGAERTLALNGHVDVVPAEEENWTRVAWAGGAEADGMIYGRGASDMLAAVAGYVMALRAVKAASCPAVNVEFHSVPSEELGGNGTLAVLERAGTPDWVVIGEPTGNRLCESTLGFHHFTVEVEGQSAHMASVDPSGAAIEKLPKVLSALAAVRADLGRRIAASAGFTDYRENPLAIGMIRGGSVPAVPPARCVLDATAFSSPTDTRDDVLGLLRHHLADVPGTSVRIRRMSFPGNAPSPDRGLVEAVTLARTGQQAATQLTGFASPCDLRHYTSRGAAGVVYGPGDLSVAHAADERVSIEALTEFTTSLARLIAQPPPAGSGTSVDSE